MREGEGRGHFGHAVEMRIRCLEIRYSGWDFGGKRWWLFLM